MTKGKLRIFKKKERKKRAGLAVFVILLFIFTGSGMYFFVKQTFLVEDVIFIGNRYFKDEEIKELSGIKKGDKLFSVSGREIHERLKRSPWIEDAVIKKRVSGLGEGFIVTGKILIEVAEATPIAILSMSEGKYFVNEDGDILEQINEKTVLSLPVIKINPYEARDAYIDALRIASVLHNRRLLPYEFGIEIVGQRPEDIALKVDGILMKIGTGDIGKKLERLGFIMGEIKRRNIVIEYIDLRFTDKIIVSPVEGIEGEQRSLPISLN